MAEAADKCSVMGSLHERGPWGAGDAPKDMRRTELLMNALEASVKRWSGHFGLTLFIRLKALLCARHPQE